MLKVAILEASHWHFPLYLEALAAADIDMVAVSDAENASGPEVAARFSARSHPSWRRLLVEEAPDFVFCFGRHCDMAEMATALIERRIPFAIEKPCGVNAGEVGEISRLAREAGLFTAVPFILRHSELPKHLQRLNGAATGRWRHMSFRFIAGPVERYIGANCPWMLARETAGGGCAINLAVHFIDLVLNLTGERIASVSAQMMTGEGAADVEIFSTMRLTTESGVLCAIDTGYTYPAGAAGQREFSFSLASDRAYLQSRGDGLTMTPRDGTAENVITFELNTDAFYAEFVRSTLGAFRAGAASPAGLAEMERVMQVIDSAYLSAGRGGAPVRIIRA